MPSTIFFKIVCLPELTAIRCCKSVQIPNSMFGLLDWSSCYIEIHGKIRNEYMLLQYGYNQSESSFDKLKPKPRLSILMPFRIAGITIAQAADSIVAQSFTDFELIAVADHCRDDSKVILNACGDPRFRILDNPGEGLVEALNFGVSACRARWVVRMDADDIMHPDRLLHLWNETKKNPVPDLVASCVHMFPEESLSNGYLEYMRWQNRVLTPEQVSNEIYVESPFAHPSIMFRKSLVESLGGYRKGDFPEDYELWLRMHQAGARMLKLPRDLLSWRDSGARLSRTHPSYRREAFDRLRARYLAADARLATDRPLVIWGAGRKTRKRCKLLLNHGFVVSAWIDIDPRKIGNRLEAAPVVDPMWLEHRSPKPFILNYVTNHGAREEIAALLKNFGYRPGSDFLPVG
jgi:glycosyltransferase involved in cell wall biosynthesis